MARPKKKGLDYFPVDTDIFQDEKIQIVFAKFGYKAHSIALQLFCSIYKQGAFMNWNQDTEALFLNSQGKHIKLSGLREVITALLDYGLFNKNVFEKFGILTSSGIQKRYELVRRFQKRENDIPSDYLIIPEKQGGDDALIPEKGGEIKVNKIKVNKIKEKDLPEKSGGNSHLNNQENNFPHGSDEYYAEEGRRLYRAVHGDK